MTDHHVRPGSAGPSDTLRNGVMIAVGAMLLQVVALAVMKHPWICACGHVAFWHANASGPETSQHLTDWYTFSHVLHGFIFYWVLWLVAPGMSLGMRLALAIGIEVAWEVIENMPMVIERYRQSALAKGYFGDSVVNSVADTVAAALGFLLAATLPRAGSVLAVIGTELVLAYLIRDNLTLNIIQLLYPIEAISRWQLGG